MELAVLDEHAPTPKLPNRKKQIVISRFFFVFILFSSFHFILLCHGVLNFGFTYYIYHTCHLSGDRKDMIKKIIDLSGMEVAYLGEEDFRGCFLCFVGSGL